VGLLIEKDMSLPQVAGPGKSLFSDIRG
jgi:hypothetical protein